MTYFKFILIFAIFLFLGLIITVFSQIKYENRIKNLYRSSANSMENELKWLNALLGKRKTDE
ncbi:MAG: hypothetical protein KJ737_22365 [Proteobacteria bacterium]|nr:hypothetical protein [Pseudomonadota bacterium]